MGNSLTIDVHATIESNDKSYHCNKPIDKIVFNDGYFEIKGEQKEDIYKAYIPYRNITHISIGNPITQVVYVSETSSVEMTLSISTTRTNHDYRLINRLHQIKTGMHN